MSKAKLDFETVRSLAAEIGDAGMVSNAVSIRAKGQLLAWIPPHKYLEPGILAVRVDPQLRAELVEAAPDIYFFTKHYENYPTVLVRLSAIPKDALRDLLHMAWSAVASTATKPSERRRPAVKRKRKRTE